MKNHSFETITADLKDGRFAPLYVLVGEEPYFIDRITDLILEVALPEHDKDFNQTILYGADVTAGDVLNAARRFPMMAERQVVVVREAQHLKDIEMLTAYAKKPLASTILVINYKYKTLDKRRTFSAAVDTNGILFESRKITDYHLPGFITTLLKGYHTSIDAKAAQMLSDFVGNDLGRLDKELDKLRILLPPKAKHITAELVEQNVGISKEYNNFELLRAVITRNNLRAHTIARYFAANPKNNPIQATLAVLFNFFSNLIVCHYAPDQSEQGLMAALSLRQSFQVKDYLTGLYNYSAGQAVHTIEYIRLTDARSKGVDNVSTPDHQLLSELLYRILH
ncbi:MAG: DNA polymerase III subunit delta [Tannerellaceae bacterium]|jgi:DNA polymerase-3 subunit delta|nr:DNA polymerase III subunit delta [Tannerellaceae bacterium]